ncbi:MAG TPA: phosphatase PAP2 family protein [Herpetosiphonaceae bacterium]
MPTRTLNDRSARAATQATAGRWLLVQGFHATLQRFADDWNAEPAGRRSTWLRTLAIGWVLGAALMLALVWLCRTQIEDETALLQRVLEILPMSFHAAIWIETPGNSVFLLPITLLAVIIAIWWGAPLRALSLAAAFVLIDTLVLIGWWTWDRPRPDLVYGGIAAPGFHAFPSGHVAQTIAVYGLLAYFWVAASTRRLERALAIMLCTLLVVIVALSRIRLGAHWPSDVVAGAILGGAWLAVLIVALRRAEAHRAAA